MCEVTAIRVESGSGTLGSVDLPGAEAKEGNAQGKVGRVVRSYRGWAIKLYSIQQLWEDC